VYRGSMAVSLDMARSLALALLESKAISSPTAHAEYAEAVRVLKASFERPPQSQESLTDQLIELITVANRAGLYDAADWITKQVGQLRRA